MYRNPPGSVHLLCSSLRTLAFLIHKKRRTTLQAYRSGEPRMRKAADGKFRRHNLLQYRSNQRVAHLENLLPMMCPSQATRRLDCYLCGGKPSWQKVPRGRACRDETAESGCSKPPLREPNIQERDFHGVSPANLAGLTCVFAILLVCEGGMPDT
ncbi:hypothetical protein B0O99DRAFT_607747 [Bisporella sp. PMI_857]|nr:hypothetical protein B0O99DRAFT_607747 [Bisporella sp. PMI_857]